MLMFPLKFSKLLLYLCCSASDSICVIIPVDIRHIAPLLHQHQPAVIQRPSSPLFVPDVVSAQLILLAQVHALLHGAGPARQGPGAAVAIRIFVFLHVTD